MIWVSGRSASDLCRTSSQTSRKQNKWKLLETSFSCVATIHCFWKTSPEKRPGATSSIRKQNDNRWRGVQWLPQDQKESSANPRPKHCWSPSSTTKASSIKNLFLRVKALVIPHFTRQFWTDCYSVSGGFGQSCTGLENGCCSTIMSLHTLRSVCINACLRCRCAWSPSSLLWYGSCGLLSVSPFEGGQRRCTFCGREFHQWSWDSRSMIDSTGGFCLLFSEAVRKLSNLLRMATILNGK